MAINLQSNVPKTGYTAPKINVPSTYNTTGLNTAGTPLIGMPTTQPKPKVVTTVVNDSNAQNQGRKAQEVVNTSTQTPPMYDKITGELTDAGKAAGMTPMSGGKVITPPTPVTPPAPLTPEQTLANMPEPGFQEAYNLQTGKREDQSIGAELPQGYSKSNPITRTDVQNTISDTTTGTTYKQFSDGTYGRFDAQGNYSKATAGAFASAQQGKATNDTINSIINGTFKLPASQQAQITALQNTYNDAITQQQTVNANAQGGASLMANMSGLVGSASGAGIVQATVENGIKKVASLQSELAGKVAEMTVAFEKDDISALQTSYSQYLNAQDNIQTEINNTATKVQATKDKQDVKNQTYALTQATKYRDTTEPISQFDTPAEVDRKIQTSSIYQNELKTKTGEVDPVAIKGMVDSYKLTGVVPSFSGLMGAPQRAAFWAAVGGNTDAIATATSNKIALSAASSALTNQKKIGEATKTAVNAMEGGLQLAEGLSKKVDRTGSPIANQYLLWTQGKLGAADQQTMSDINAFDAAITTVSQEYAKIMTGAAASIAGTTVSSQADAKAFINKELTQKQFEGVASILRADAKIRLTAYDTTIKSITDDIANLGATTINNDTSSTGTTGLAEVW